MHVHPPDEPIVSIRQFLLHILTITIGLLIALALEGLVTRLHERNLVHEARTNLRAELTESRAKLIENLKAQQQEAAAMRQFLEFATALRKDRHAPPPGDALSGTFVLLPDTNWNTATAMGAISLMPYTEVRLYSKAYEGERAYMDIEADAKRSLFTLAGLPDDYAAMSDTQLAEGEKLLRVSLALEMTLIDSAERLIGAIDDALRQGAD